MHLINDEYLVSAVLGLEAHLFGESPDVFDGIIGSGIEFDDVEGSAFVEGLARGARVAGLEVMGALFAIENLCKDAGTGCFTNTTGAGE